MNMIAHLNTDMLYMKALTDGIPFFDWYTWIESTTQKEVFSQLRRSKIMKTDSLPKSPKATSARKNSQSSSAKKSSSSRPKSKPSKGNTPTKDKSQVSGLVNTYNYSFNAKEKTKDNPAAGDKNASSFQSK